MQNKSELEENVLKAEHTYLIKQKISIDMLPTELNSITVLLATNTAYHIRWNDTNAKATSWWLKKQIHDEYELIEDITNAINATTSPSITTSLSNAKYKSCPICNGLGTILSPETTTGSKTCPVCNGGGVIVNY